jgi:hypothetical protein
MKTKFKKFEPLNPVTVTKIQELLDRGGEVILETKTHVEIKRISSIATIDQWGRVDWRPC